MTKEKAKEPQLRFKGFTDAWEQRKLGELGTLKNGMNFSKEAMGIGYPFVNLQNIFGSNVVDVKNLGLAMASDSQLKDYNLLEGDVLFVRSSVKLEGVGEAAVIPQTLENTTYSGFIIRFRDRVGLVREFKQFVFGTEPVRKQIMSQATDSANKNISQSVLENLEIRIPSFDEQQQIGRYFCTIDHLITLHQRKCDLLSKAKKTLLQKMFPKNGETTPEIRFKGFTGAWEQRKLENIFDIHTDFVSNGSFQALKENVAYYTEENYAYMIRLQDASNNWKGPWLYTNKHGYDFLKKSSLKPNDILMSDRGTIGKFFQVPELDRPMTLASNAVLLRSIKNDNTFLFNLMSTKNIQTQIVLRTTPGAQPMISKTEFKKITAQIPDKKEQEKIGQYFESLDHLITLHQHELEKLKNIKKSCLKMMFV